MSFFTTGALSSGQSYDTGLDGTWAYATFDYEWSVAGDATAAATVYAAVDEGANWFPIFPITDAAQRNQIGLDSDSFGAVQYAAPINAVKVEVTAAATGNTLTVRFTGC